MPTLLLLRHAKSSWDDPHLSDHARPLNLRGRQAAVAMAAAMRALGLQPDVVLVSSARRTLQTLEALEPWAVPPTIEPLDALYLAPAADILDVIRRVSPGAGCVLVVGHNPGLHELAIRLSGPGSSAADGPHQRVAGGYPSGTLTQFALTGAWAEADAATMRLTRFLAPADLASADLAPADPAPADPAPTNLKGVRA